MAGANITRFKPDRRTSFCGLLKSAALLGLLFTLVYCVFTYYEQFTFNNIKKLGINLTAAAQGTDGDFAGYTFEAGTSSVYEDFGSGLAVLSSDTLSFINAAGREELSSQLKYSSPAMSVCGDNMIAYDRGAMGLCVTNRVSALWQAELKSDIVSATINDSGAYCVVTDEQGYRAAVTVFGANHKEKFKWMTSEFYIMNAALSPDSHQVAALCMSERDGKRATTLRVFSTGREEPLFDIDIGSTQVYSMQYYKNGELMLITDEAVIVYGQNGEETGRFQFQKGELITFAHMPEELPCVALTTGEADARNKIVMVDERGGALQEAAFEKNIRAVSGSGSNVAVLLTDCVATIKPGSEPIITNNISARDIIMRSDATVMLIYADRAELMDTRLTE